MSDLERQKTEREGSPKRIPFFAFEGVGGSGKSHIIKALELELATSGYSTTDYKVSGMGTGERIDRLRSIKERRSELIAKGVASERIIQDSQRDRIFMLAMQYQTKSMLTEVQNRRDLDLIFLDRTPLMPWVYSISKDGSNPYLNEILLKGVEYSKRLNIDTQYLFDISPETAYARMIARICTQTANPGEIIDGVCTQIEAPPESAATIRQATLRLLDENHNIVPKSAGGYCFIPFQTLVNERNYFMRAGEILKRECGTRLVVVNAELRPEEITQMIRKDIEGRVLTTT